MQKRRGLNFSRKKDVLSGGEVMTAAHGCIFVRGSYTGLPCCCGGYGIIGCRKGKDGRSPVRAQFAHSSQFGDTVCIGHEVQNVSERTTFGIPVESYDYHVRPVCVHGFRNEGYQVSKELGLFHDYQARS
jgi:hypothetical protein